MGVSTSHTAKLASGERGSDLVKDVVASTLEKARQIAATKLGAALEGIDTKGLKPTEATQVAVGLATVVEKIENRNKKDRGVAIIYKTSGRKSSDYEEVELRVG
jgi:hypothetical protein